MSQFLRKDRVEFARLDLFFRPPNRHELQLCYFHCTVTSDLATPAFTLRMLGTIS